MSGFKACCITLVALLFAGAAGAVTIHVPAGQPTIQAGINAASEGDTVLVAPGTYSGIGNRDLDYGGVNIALIGSSGPEFTVVDCEHHGRGVSFHGGEDPTSLLSGFTIVNGLADVGGAIKCDGASPTIEHCILSDNAATSDVWGAGGGGIYCTNASPSVTDVALLGNSARRGGGIVCRDASQATLKDLTFSDNTVGRVGAGLYCIEFSDATVLNCAFHDGVAAESGGGIYCDNASPSVSGCTFVGNFAAGIAFPFGGGAIHCYKSDMTISNATLVGNAAMRGGGILARDSYPIVLETILAFASEGEAVHCMGWGAVTLTCCDIYGNVGGDWIGCIADQLGASGNFTADPLFCNLAANDLTLSESSPCAPAGNDCGTLIGARPIGCEAVSVESMSWGSIKALYR